MLSRRSITSCCSPQSPCSRVLRKTSLSCPSVGPKKGPDRARFLSGFSRERLENLVMQYVFENTGQRCMRDQLRFQLRKLVGRYLHMKLHRSGLMCLSPSAAKQTVEQLSGAQQHRMLELEEEQRRLVLSANSLCMQLRVQNRATDQMFLAMRPEEQEFQMCPMTQTVIMAMKDEIARLREAVDKKRRELIKLRRHLAKGRCIARDVSGMVHNYNNSVLDDVRTIRWRRGILERDCERAVQKVLDSEVPYRPLAPWDNLMYLG